MTFLGIRSSQACQPAGNNALLRRWEGEINGFPYLTEIFFPIFPFFFNSPQFSLNCSSFRLPSCIFFFSLAMWEAVYKGVISQPVMESCFQSTLGPGESMFPARLSLDSRAPGVRGQQEEPLHPDSTGTSWCQRQLTGFQRSTFSWNRMAS